MTLRGFTLIETLVVTVIIAGAATLGFRSLASTSDGMDERRLLSELRSLDQRARAAAARGNAATLASDQSHREVVVRIGTEAIKALPWPNDTTIRLSPGAKWNTAIEYNRFGSSSDFRVSIDRSTPGESLEFVVRGLSGQWEAVQ